MYNYGLVGNCNISALISKNGSLDWLCLPRPDSAPVFGRLLDSGGGQFSIESVDSTEPQVLQRYLENTNVLNTEITTPQGKYRIIDFCPRFEQHGRMFRPLSLIRIVEPISGTPTIQIKCSPIEGWNKKELHPNSGSNHLRYDIGGDSLRLTTNMPLTYLRENTSFRLSEKIYFHLTWNSTIDEDLAQLSESFLSQTINYWKLWVKHCSIPSLFQRETIRSALTLKLHCYEDTGAILAALTTSLPEEPENTRNWDYRYCWLRDAYFVLSAFHNLGHFEEMEGFVKFLLNIAHHHEASHERLAPVYTLNRELPLPEIIYDNWEGYRKSQPVRMNNQAAEHVQNDVYGEMILTLSPIFFDERFFHLRTQEHQDLLANLAKLASKSIGKPDAGLWEIRGGWQEHTFTNLMSWAGFERLERIQKMGYLQNLTLDLSAERHRAETAIDQALQEGSLRNGPKDSSYDSALSLMAVLRYPKVATSAATVDAIRKSLVADGGEGGFYYRYLRKDDFGTPTSAFVVCSFWIAQALARLGRHEEALSILNKTVKSSNSLGLYAEHYLPQVHEQRGNFPQAYSHVGLINAAFSISPPWSEVL